MRTLTVLFLLLASFSCSAQAHYTGAKSKSYLGGKKAHGSKKSFRRNYWKDDRRSAVGSRYQYQNFPIWAARALEPKQTR